VTSLGALQFYKNELTSYANVQDDKAKVELPLILLEKLVLSGELPGNECKCLNDASRRILWKSLLQKSKNNSLVL
jgi:hypothetical protein